MLFASRFGVGAGRSARWLCTLTLALALAACGASTQQPIGDVSQQAARYIALALAVEKLRPGEVDAYFGAAPPVPATVHPPQDLAAVQEQARQLMAAVSADQQRQPSVRRSRLLGKLRQLQASVALLRASSPPPFDAQARLVYRVHVDITESATQLAALRNALQRQLPGVGPLPVRMQTWRSGTLIPLDRRAAVFERAVQECRRRTALHWILPPGESLRIEWTRQTPAAWHRYLGRLHSRLQVNPDAVAYLHSVITLACHETYPGHHAQYLQRELAAQASGLLPEDQLVLLHSTESVLLEAAATLAANRVFPALERERFEREVLAPLAGLAPAAPATAQIADLEAQLVQAALPTLRAYHDGSLPAAQALRRLQEEHLVPDGAALLQFARTQGAYVLGYTALVNLLGHSLGPDSTALSAQAWDQLRQVVADPAHVRLPFLIEADQQ